jgi:ribonuclease HI
MESKIDIFTDGSSKPTNPGPGGWGFIAITKNREYHVHGSGGHSTNNRMELQAAIEAIQWFPNRTLMIHTDSSYVKDGITSWIRGWKKRGWKTSANKDVKNVDLWKILDDLVEKGNVTFRWVKAHSTNLYNNKVDALARLGAEEN